MKLNMNSGFKTFLLWASLFLGIVLIVQVTEKIQTTVANIDYSSFQEQLKTKQIKSVTITGNVIEGEREIDGKKSKFSTLGPPVVDSAFVKMLQDSGVEVYKFKPPENDNLWQLFMA